MMLRHGSLPRRRRTFLRDRSAVGAVEFAIVAPLLLLLYMGVVETTLAVTAHRKVQHSAAAMADLVTLQPEVTPAMIEDFYKAAAAIIQPNETSGFSVRISGIEIDAAGQATVAWSWTHQAAAPTKGSAVELPDDLKPFRSRFLIYAQTSYPYKPLGLLGFQTPIPMTGSSYYSIRGASAVECPACS
ncbi:TadE/TadG family type IV pilus assembly protein [Mangrovibrevibacter kandeliae]|uniref:TadE/TadG family type IV pilus assembly protein n=1 Tax=Mangrovibrevibacter kandeliae TaxID=2968473 RepID=UPI0021181D32|nr:TadE/TadG family type IV pilus assembly protein [Aurantimonas sp. CSK15Z-1]MCQ8780582.1 pilus assembly protein [Aurantimonas sp. CSK15Z-1]